MKKKLNGHEATIKDEKKHVMSFLLVVDRRDRGVLVLGVLDVKSVPDLEIVDLMSAFVSRYRRDSPRPGNTHPRQHL